MARTYLVDLNSTGFAPLDTYETAFGDLMASVAPCDRDRAWDSCMRLAADCLTGLLTVSGVDVESAEPVELVRPKYYNYSTDSMTVRVTLGNDAVDDMESAADDRDFTEWLRDNYTSRDGYVSFTANDPDEYRRLVCDGHSQEVTAWLRYRIDPFELTWYRQRFLADAEGLLDELIPRHIEQVYDDGYRLVCEEDGISAEDGGDLWTVTLYAPDETAVETVRGIGSDWGGYARGAYDALMNRFDGRYDFTSKAARDVVFGRHDTGYRFVVS